MYQQTQEGNKILFIHISGREMAGREGGNARQADVIFEAELSIKFEIQHI